jgi:hypothetical protein
VSPVSNSEQFAAVRELDDNPAALAHRTDRIALRNESNTPVVFVDDDPLFSLAPDAETVREDPLKTTASDVRHQHHSVDVDDLTESETTIREVIDQFEADTDRPAEDSELTGRRFYYALMGEHAQICGNGLEDYFDAIANFRTSYRDLEQQLEPAGKYQRDGFPHDNESMIAQCIGLTSIEGVWLRFNIRLNETPDGEHHYSTTLSVTTVEQHGPLTARWLDNRLDHPAIGSPSPVDRQYAQVQAKFPLGPQPLSDVKHHRLIGYRGRDETVEYVTCENPYYRAEQPARGEQFNRLDELDVPDDVSRQVVNIDRIPLRPRGGSHGVDEDVFIKGAFEITQFGASTGPGAGGVALLSGKVNPVREEDFAEWKEAVLAERERQNQGLFDRLKS